MRAAAEPGYALDLRYRQKWSKHGEACRAQGIKFIPLPVETFGSWSEDATSVIGRLGKDLARATNQDESEVSRHLFGRLSILLMKGNSTLILNRTPALTDARIDGDI